MRPFASAKTFVACLVAALALSVFTGAPVSAATALEYAMWKKINYARTSRGIKPLPLRSGLSWYAREHSRQMASRQSLYHSDLTRICCYDLIGENVGYGGALYQIHRAFMASPGHRHNILGRWNGVGVGIVVDGNGRIWVTEVFRDYDFS